MNERNHREDEAVVYSANSGLGLTAVLKDLFEGLHHSAIWRAFAWNEINQRYRRSVLGLLWIVITYFFFVGTISVFFGGFTSRDPSSFVSYVALGYAAFMFMLGSITEGCVVFKTAANWIKSTSLPYSVHIYRSITRLLFVFVVQVTSGFVAIFFLGWRPGWGALEALPALLLILLNSVWIHLFFGLIASRWRDVTHLIGATSRLMYFTTPILWVYTERTGLRKQLASFNPMTHFLEIFRAPLLGEPTSPESWTIAFIWTIAGIVVTLAVASLMQRRLPFWV